MRYQARDFTNHLHKPIQHEENTASSTTVSILQKRKLLILQNSAQGVK